MRFVIFGLTVTSSWGNGHATLWRGLLKAMARRGHSAIFYEKNVSWYADTRDAWTPPRGVDVRLYDSLPRVMADARKELDAADVAICTSYCPDGPHVSRAILDSRAAIRSFYDLDTPVTLTALRSDVRVLYLPTEGLSAFDLVLSYTGGRALNELQTRLGARRVAALYGSVDPETHSPVAPMREFRGELCYLGTYAADRQSALEELFVKPASRLRYSRFVIGGAQYPRSFPWRDNMYFVRHLAPSLHSAFFCSSRATLNITRASMAAYGYCPSGRLFEAAACGAPILSDGWEGLETFFAPGKEILCVDTAEDVMRILAASDADLHAVSRAARERTLEEHTAARRIAELERICESVLANDAGVATAA